MFAILLLGLLGLLIYFYAIVPVFYWRKRGIPATIPWPVVGNMGPMALKTRHMFDLIEDMYKKYPNQRYFGSFQFLKPILIIKDLELIKKVTIKDFDHFMDHNPIVSEEADPLLGKNLIALRGQKWKHMRATVSPTFTSSKMRAMFLLLCQCAEQFTSYLEKQGSGVVEYEFKDLFTRYTNDAIASIAFGLECNSLEDRDNDFYTLAKNMTNFGKRWFRFLLLNFSQALTKFFKIGLFDKEESSYFRQIVTDTIRQREESGLVRPDMINILMEARRGLLKQDDHQQTKDAGFATVEEYIKPRLDKPEITDDDITAQAVIFILGGFDATATLMCLMAHELAVNPDIQKKLQEEVDETLEQCNGKITYEALLSMKYLDMVLSETLRKWPPGIQLDRICAKDYTIEPISPEEQRVVIKKGEVIQVPLVGIHRDPAYFPDPLKFDPERFSDENKHNIHPLAFMPFGLGPRNCIASRFVLLENKALMFHLLSKFDIEPIGKTQIPLQLDKKTFNLMPENGFWLGLKQRSDTA